MRCTLCSRCKLLLKVTHVLISLVTNLLKFLQNVHGCYWFLFLFCSEALRAGALFLVFVALPLLPPPLPLDDDDEDDDDDDFVGSALGELLTETVTSMNVTLPATLDTSHVYAPACSFLMLPTLRVLRTSPGSATPLRYH